MPPSPAPSGCTHVATEHHLCCVSFHFVFLETHSYEAHAEAPDLDF